MHTTLTIISLNDNFFFLLISSMRPLTKKNKQYLYECEEERFVFKSCLRKVISLQRTDKHTSWDTAEVANLQLVWVSFGYCSINKKNTNKLNNASIMGYCLNMLFVVVFRCCICLLSLRKHYPSTDNTHTHSYTINSTFIIIFILIIFVHFCYYPLAYLCLS